MSVTIDFVAIDAERGACILALVEEGPWTRPIVDHLRDLQDRLYGCLEAALGGQIAARFPEAAGKKIVVRVDCYDVPREPVDAFMERFTAAIRDMPDYSPASSPWVHSFEFELNHDRID